MSVLFNNTDDKHLAMLEKKFTEAFNRLQQAPKLNIPRKDFKFLSKDVEIFTNKRRQLEGCAPIKLQDKHIVNHLRHDDAYTSWLKKINGNEYQYVVIKYYYLIAIENVYPELKTEIHRQKRQILGGNKAWFDWFEAKFANDFPHFKYSTSTDVAPSW